MPEAAGPCGALVDQRMPSADAVVAHTAAPPSAEIQGETALLTRRQTHCLQLAAEGLTSRGIGRRLGLSARTVDDHLAVVCRRLGVRTRVQAVAAALTLGAIRAPTG